MLAQARKDKGRGNFRNKKRPHAAKAKSFVGLTPEMAVLYPPTSQEYDELTNGIQAYLDSAHEKLTSEFGMNGSFIKQQGYRNIVEPVAPATAFNRNIQATVIAWDVHKADLIDYHREKRQLETDKPKMFGIMIGNLSPASKSLIKSDGDWGAQNLETVQCPLLLSQLLVKTHMAANTGSSALDKVAAQRAFAMFRQKDDSESPTDLRRRLEACVSRMKALQCSHQPTVEEQVAAFAMALTGRYAAYSTEFQNMNIMRSDKIPKTLAEVERDAVYFRGKSSASHEHKRSSDPGVAYTTRELDDAVRSALENATYNPHGDDRRQNSFAAHTSGTGKPSRGGKGGQRKNRFGKGSHAQGTGDGQAQQGSSAGGRHVRFDDESGDNSGQPPGKRKSQTCLLCKQPGHWVDKCPFLSKTSRLIQEDKITLVTFHCPLAATAHTTPLGPYDVLLDNQSNTNVFHCKQLLTKMCRVPEFNLGGIAAGPQLTSDRAGHVKGVNFGLVHLFTEATANVLSLDLVADIYTVDWNQDSRTFTVRVPGMSDFVFSRQHGGLFVCDFSFLLERGEAEAITDPITRKRHTTLFTTASDNERLYQKRDVIRARRARRLLRRLGYAPPQVVGRMLNQGAVINCDSTSKDIVTADRIYGKLVPELRGKTVRQKGLDILTVEPGHKLGPQQVLMSTDVIYVNRWAVLLSVFDPINLTAIRCIDTRSRESNKPTARDLRIALDETLNEILEQAALEVTECHADGEFNNEEALAPLVNRGVKPVICPPGTHVVRAERKARVVKERVRAHLSDLPYLLPFFLLPWLLAFVVFCLNCVPVRARGFFMSPYEFMSGRKLNAQRDLRHEFGEYAEAFDPHGTSNSVTDQRTEAVLLLLNTRNVQGDVHCYSLGSERFVRRSQWTPLPMPDIVINKLNALAAAEPASHQITASPDFYIGDGTEELRGQFDADEEEALVNAPDQEFVRSDYIADDEYYMGDPTVTPNSEPTATPTTVPTQEFRLADNVLLDSDGDVVMDLAQTRTPDKTPVLNYTLGEQSESGGARFAFMLHCRKAVFLGGKVFRLTIKAAEKRHGMDKTVDTLKTELKQMLSKKVWRPEYWNLLTSEEKRSVIRSSLFLKEKYDAAGLFQKLKARLVAGGNWQDRTIYSDSEMSSPTVSTSSVFIVATIAAKERRKVVTLDYSGAYLNATMKRSVRMILEPRLAEVLCEMEPSYRKYLRLDGSLCVKLTKALYGCVESAKLWYDLVSSQLRELGFVPNDYDPCVFNKYVNGDQVTITLYVDDLLITCADQETLDCTIIALDALFEGSTVHRGATHSYIGMLFDFSELGRVHVRMDGYIDDFLSEYDVKGSAPTPARGDLFDVDRDAELLDPLTKDMFHSRVAKVLFCAKRSRPDLLTATSFLATRVQAPTSQDYGKLIRLLKYVNGTRDLWLTLEAEEDWGLFAYIDAAYGQHPDGKSHTGVCMLLGKGAFYVQSSKQRIVSKSSTEAEIVAVSDGLSEVIWARNFLVDQGVPLGPAVVYQDNMSTMALMEKGRSTSSRTKHISIRYFFVKDRVESGEVVIRYAPTEQMVADMLTKPLQGELFRKLRMALLNLRERQSAAGEE